MIRIVIDLLNPEYHGLRDDGYPDWPPSPLRVCSALLAGCHVAGVPDTSARDALAHLVRLPAPDILTSGFVHGRLPPTYAPRTGLLDRPSRQALALWTDGGIVGLADRHRVAKPQDAMFLAEPRIVYEVDEGDSPIDVRALDRAAHAVPYFGRSHDVADITITRGDVPVPSLRWVPRADPTGSSHGWGPRCLEWMDDNHHLSTSGSQRPPLPVGPYSQSLNYQRVGHRRGGRQSGASPIHVITLPLRHRRASAQVASLMARLVRPDNVTMFPCVVAGFDHADGAQLGVGLSGERIEALTNAAEQLRSSNPGTFASPEWLPGRRTLDPDAWTAPSTRWISATPYRAFPDERVLAHVLAATTIPGVSGEASIRLRKVARSPHYSWQHRWRQPGDGLGCWFLEIETDQAVDGPLQLGASTELGFGLFVRDRGR